MRRLLFCLLALSSTAAFAAPTTGPDLDVAYISITPRPPSYQPTYRDGYGHPVNPETNQEITLEQAQAIKHYHAPGDTVTFTARVVNHGAVRSAPFTYTWSVDGTVIASGSSEPLEANAKATGSGTYTVRGFNGNANGYTFRTATLTPGTFAEFSTPWTWQDGQHTVTFTVTPAEGSTPEVSTRNNTRTDWTDALSFFMTVRRSAYNAFTTVKNFTDSGAAGYPEGHGSYSFEDWLQYHVDLMHDKFRKSVYPTAPDGIKEHIRLDTLLILEDDEPRDNVGDLRAVNGWDGTWQFGNYPSANAQVKDWGLLHEWGHQIGLIDLYNLDLIPSDNHVLDVDGYRTGLGRTAHQGGMMRGHGDTIFSESDALALNSQLGRRRGWYGDYQYLIPASNRIRVLDTGGQPVANAEVLVYQTKPIPNTPVFQGKTDADGYFSLPNRTAPHITTEYRPGASRLYTLRDNPFGTVDVVGNASSLLFRVRSGERREFFWLDITDFNRAYWKTGPDAATYAFETHFPTEGSPAAPANLQARLAGATSVQLTWGAGTAAGGPAPQAPGYRVFKAVEPEYEWQPVAEVSGTSYTDTVGQRQIVRYAVTTRSAGGPDSGFSNEVGIYSFGDMRGIAREANGTILVADYPREQPIWLRPDFSPIEAFGSVHNHVSALDLAILPDGFVASVGSPVGYEPVLSSALLVVPADGSNHNGQPARSRLVRVNGTAANQWNAPEGLAVGRQGVGRVRDIIVTDTGNRRVEVLESDARTSKFSFGQDHLTRPTDTVQTNDGTYIVSDPAANQLVRFDSTGTYLGTVPLPGAAYIALGPDGVLAVSQTTANTVAILNPDLSVKDTITAADAVNLSQPRGVTWGENGELFIADAGNRRVVRVSTRPAVVWGDVNGDGAFEAEDVRLALRITAGLETATPDQVLRGDVVKGPNILPDVVDLRDTVALASNG